MCRHDSLGATSIARALMLEPALYGCLMHFFHAHSWEAGKISQQWAGMLGRFAYKAHGMPVLIADGVKAAKEGRKMPGAQKIALKTGGKSAQIGIGQMFGAVGLLIGDGFAQCCPIVSIRLRSGQKGMAAWGGDEAGETALSSAVLAYRDAAACAMAIGQKCALVADRAFLSVAGLREAACHAQWLDVVVRAKMNTAAYAEPTGRQRKKGSKAKLAELFETKASEFAATTVYVYGKLQRANYYSIDLLWGNGLWAKLRFVLLKPESGSPMILACTDLGMDAEEIIELYGLRFKIEQGFKALKQTSFAFSSHFWAKQMPKLERHGKNKETDKSIGETTDPKARQAIKSAIKATNAFAQISAIALGVQQIISLRLDWASDELRWMRTPSRKRPSEGAIAEYMQRRILADIEGFSHLPIMRYIKCRQCKSLKKMAA
ncbi:MAG: transposase [Eubacteriaceae bacterium]|nr:transposase [Eubacteriaceae bacterium]